MVKATQRTIARLKAFLVPTGEGRSFSPEPPAPLLFLCVCCEEREALMPFSACQACIQWRLLGTQGSYLQLRAIEDDISRSAAQWIPHDWLWRVEYDPDTGLTTLFYARRYDVGD